MNKWSEILVGLILIIIAVFAWTQNLYGFGTATLEFLKGGIIWIIILIGALFLLLGITDLKN